MCIAHVDTFCTRFVSRTRKNGGGGGIWKGGKGRGEGGRRGKIEKVAWWRRERSAADGVLYSIEYNSSSSHPETHSLIHATRDHPGLLWVCTGLYDPVSVSLQQRLHVPVHHVHERNGAVERCSNEPLSVWSILHRSALPQGAREGEEGEDGPEREREGEKRERETETESL